MHTFVNFPRQLVSTEVADTFLLAQHYVETISFTRRVKVILHWLPDWMSNLGISILTFSGTLSGFYSISFNTVMSCNIYINIRVVLYMKLNQLLDTCTCIYEIVFDYSITEYITLFSVTGQRISWWPFDLCVTCMTYHLKLFFFRNTKFYRYIFIYNLLKNINYYWNVLLHTSLNEFI